MTTPLKRGRFLFREVNERGYDLPLGSVTKDGGVEFRSDLDISVWNPAEDVSGYKRVQPDDFVIGLRSFQSGIGHSTIEALVSPAYTVLRPISTSVHPSFFRYLFKSNEYISRLENVAQGIRQGRTIAVADFYNIECPVPPLESQRAIADFLDSETARIDALIAKKQRLIGLCEARWRRHLLESVAPHLEGLPVPGSWNQGRLRNLVDHVVGGSWGAEPGEQTFDLPCVRAADFDFRSLTAAGGAVRSYGFAEKAARLVRPGDLVLEKSGGGDEAPVGRVVRWVGETDAVPTNFAARIRPTHDHDPLYVLFAFRAAYEAGLNWRSIKQTTGIQNLDSGAYLSEPWPTPPKIEQSSIAKHLQVELDTTLQLVGSVTRQIELLREHRQALITAAVTGQIEVPGVAA